jgi:hypothetical protein
MLLFRVNCWLGLGPAPGGTGCRCPGATAGWEGFGLERDGSAAQARVADLLQERSFGVVRSGSPAGAERRPPHRRGLAGAAAVSAPALAAAVWVAIPKPTRGDRPPAAVQGDEPPDRQLLL